MKKRSTFVLLVGLFILTFNIAPQAVGLPTEIEGESIVTWMVNVAPRNITNMYYSEGGNMLAENGSLMYCSVNTTGDNIVGHYTIGNVSVTANDTQIARDLVLGVWGTPTEWWPGLFIETGSSNIESLNASAYAAAERVSGNYLNGTMTSRYDNLTISVWNSIAEANELVNESCIIFDYEQDPPLFGEPQITHLSYSLNTGVLVIANTSYSFGVPYNLVIVLTEIAPLVPYDHPVIPQNIVLSGLLGGIILAVLVVVYMRFSNRN